MIRTIDIFVSVAGLIFGVPLFVLIWLIVWIDTRAPLFRQVRIGRYQEPFLLVKFRTMSVGTASVPSHLVEASAVTPVGRVLRRMKIDELPQLWNVLRGEMSLVGPRPCLPNQEELIEARASRHIFDARPGVTGLAQLRGIDMSTPRLLAETDAEMLASLTVASYLRCVFLTVLGRGSGDRVRSLANDPSRI